MGEEEHLDIIYNVLQIVGGVSLFILCLICLYKRARAEERKNTNTATNSGPKVRVIQNSDHVKIQELENRIRNLERKV